MNRTILTIFLLFSIATLFSQKHSSYEIYYGAGYSNRYFGKYLIPPHQNRDNTFSNRIGTRANCQLNNVLFFNIGLDLSSFGYKGTRRLAFYDVDAQEFFYRTSQHWYLGMPLGIGYQLPNDPTISRYKIQAELGAIPAIYISTQEIKEFEDGRKEIDKFEKTGSAYNVNIIFSLSTAFSYAINKNLSVVLRPSYRTEFTRTRNRNLQGFYNLGVEFGLQTYIKKWWKQ